MRQARDGGLNERSAAHLGVLENDITELARLERRAQISFLGTHSFVSGDDTTCKSDAARDGDGSPMQIDSPKPGATHQQQTALESLSGAAEVVTAGGGGSHPKPAAKRDAAGRARGGRRRH